MVVRGGGGWYQCTNVDVAFERLKDTQRDLENARRWATDADVLYQAQLLVERARGLVKAIRGRMRPAVG